MGKKSSKQLAAKRHPIEWAPGRTTKRIGHPIGRVSVGVPVGQWAHYVKIMRFSNQTSGLLFNCFLSSGCPFDGACQSSGHSRRRSQLLERYRVSVCGASRVGHAYFRVLKALVSKKSLFSAVWHSGPYFSQEPSTTLANGGPLPFHSHQTSWAEVCQGRRPSEPFPTERIASNWSCRCGATRDTWLRPATLAGATHRNHRSLACSLGTPPVGLA